MFVSVVHILSMMSRALKGLIWNSSPFIFLNLRRKEKKNYTEGLDSYRITRSTLGGKWPGPQLPK